MSTSVFKQPIFLFFIKFFLLYFSWYFIYKYWIHPGHNIDLWIANNLVDGVKVILKAFHYPLINFSQYDREYRAVGIDGSNGVYIGDSCNGLTLFSIYVFFLISFPGRVLSKIYFSVIGVVVIHICNILRIFALCLVALHYPQYLDFNHTYTFTIIMYAIIFLMWYIWLNKFSKSKKTVLEK